MTSGVFSTRVTVDGESERTLRPESWLYGPTRDVVEKAEDLALCGSVARGSRGIARRGDDAFELLIGLLRQVLSACEDSDEARKVGRENRETGAR